MDHWSPIRCGVKLLFCGTFQCSAWSCAKRPPRLQQVEIKLHPTKLPTNREKSSKGHDIIGKNPDDPELCCLTHHELHFLRCEVGIMLSPSRGGMWVKWNDACSAHNAYNMCPQCMLFSHVWLFVTPWNSPGQNPGVDSFSLLQGFFPTQGLNPDLPHCRQILYQLSHKGSPRILVWVTYPFSSGSFQPRSWTRVSCIAGRFFTNWATRETPSAHRAYNKCQMVV